MAKQKIQYRCTECGYTSVQWSGKCSSCGSWGSMKEHLSQAKTRGLASSATDKPKVHKLNEPFQQSEIRVATPDVEFNRVLGGGVVLGSLVLIGGKPGIGKSTLLLQLALQMKSSKVLYLSGEESLNQVKLRAERIAPAHDNLYFLADTRFSFLEKALEEIEPDLLIVDSIQTLQVEEVESSPGSVSQIRESTSKLMQIAKSKGCSIFIIGHITKEGFIAGPKILEHMVDVVLYFDHTHLSYRIVKTTKNRFGATSEIGIYEMTHGGLLPVKNPSQLFMDSYSEGQSGVAVASTMEGQRQLLIEIQALVNDTQFGTPQRNATGFDNKRLAMLLAVLEKYCGLKLSSKDVFLNVAGGIKAQDPSVDLAVVAAVASTYFDKALKEKSVFAGELGLTGELRVPRLMENRLKECTRLGFENFYTSAKYEKNYSGLIKINDVKELLAKLFR